MQFLETRDKIVHRRLKNNSVHLRGICVLAGEKLAGILTLMAGEPKAGNEILSLLGVGERHARFWVLVTLLSECSLDI